VQSKRFSGARHNTTTTLHRVMMVITRMLETAVVGSGYRRRTQQHVLASTTAPLQIGHITGLSFELVGCAFTWRAWLALYKMYSPPQSRADYNQQDMHSGFERQIRYEHKSKQHAALSVEHHSGISLDSTTPPGNHQTATCNGKLLLSGSAI
jgi:hypothetical protein